MESLRYFCMFVGYPASGHSVIGAFIDAHRNAVISHEMHAARLIWDDQVSREDLFEWIQLKSAQQATERSSENHSGDGRHRYYFPNLCQGTAEELYVIGDKRGAGTSRTAERVGGEKLVAAIRDCVGLPLRILFTTRNPYDMVVARGKNLPAVVKEFALLNRGIASFLGALDKDELLMFKHEELIESPRTTIERLCSFLSLESYGEFVDTCSAAVFGRPTSPRLRYTWDQPAIDQVRLLIEQAPWMQDYSLEGIY